MACAMILIKILAARQIDTTLGLFLGSLAGKVASGRGHRPAKSPLTIKRFLGILLAIRHSSDQTENLRCPLLLAKR